MLSHTMKNAKLVISPQRSFVPLGMERPYPESDIYVEKNTDGIANGDFEYCGIRLVVDKANQEQGLWSELDDGEPGKTWGDTSDIKHKVRSVLFVCDELIVRSPLHLPEAHVTIFARVLRFEGTDARIDTSPYPWAGRKIVKGDDRDGAAGRTAGDIQLYVSEIWTDGEWVGDDGTAPIDPPRLIAHGGAGQDPALGEHGKDGKSFPPLDNPVKFTNEGAIMGLWVKHVNFNPPAYYARAEWTSSNLHNPDVQIKGSLENAPTNGEDAIAAGVPGNGGDGGALTTNRKAALRLFIGDGGKPGIPDPTEYKGGQPGQPIHVARYTVYIRKLLVGAVPTTKKDGDNITADGKSKKAPDVPITSGNNGNKNIDTSVEFWMIPGLIDKVLGYTEDLFIAGARDAAEAILRVYDAALAAPVLTIEAGESAEVLLIGPLVRSHRHRIATLLNRLRAGLDCFGFPPGFIPFYSLSGQVALYRQTVDRSIFLLLFANWIKTRAETMTITRETAQAVVAQLKRDSGRAVEEIKAVTEKTRDLRDRIKVLIIRLKALQTELVAVEKRLRAQAEFNETLRATLKTTLDIAATIAVAIPVGQPFLGAAVSLASVAGEMALDQTPPVEAMGKAAGIVSKTSSTILEKIAEANEAAEETEKAEAAAGDPPEKQSAQKSRLEKLAKTGAAMGDVIGKSCDILSKHTVSQDDMDKELDRLRQQSDEWKLFTERVRDLNEMKRKLFGELHDLIQRQRDAFARLEHNAGLRVVMQREDAATLAKANPALIGYVMTLERQCLRDLRFYLYMMLHSYECTVFRPIGEQFDHADWNMLAVLRKVAEMMESSPKAEDLLSEEAIGLVRIAFEGVVEKVRDGLIRDFPLIAADSPTVRMVIDRDQSPEIFKSLKEKMGTHQGTRIDPGRHGVLFLNHHIARVRDIVLAKIEFEKTPETAEFRDFNLILNVMTDDTATIRNGRHFYAASYQPGAMLPYWTATVFCPSVDAEPQIADSRKNEASKEVMAFIFDDHNADKANKVSIPPLCADLLISLNTPAGMGKLPPIRRLEFAITYEYVDPQGPPQYVLYVRPEDPDRRGVTLECSKADEGGRRHGSDEMVRIFSPDDTVTLTAHDQEHNNLTFDHWTVDGVIHPEKAVTIKITRDMTISYAMEGSPLPKAPHA